MPPHQKRVLDEKSELDEKLSKLRTFISAGTIFYTLPAAEQERLRRQAGIMADYSAVLQERIAVFEK